MKKQNKWEKFYSETPLDEISWQNTQADFLKEIIDSGKVERGKALDIGCGTGRHSVFLASKGFLVTGIDISKTAIWHAKYNAYAERQKINFLVADAADLKFLGRVKFDLVLDWGNLHGIPEDKRENYIKGIYGHMNRGGKLILRCFAKEKGGKDFVEHETGRIYLFTQDEIEEIYGKYFKILEKNESRAESKNAPGKMFYEFLMERK